MGLLHLSVVALVFCWCSCAIGSSTGDAPPVVQVTVYPSLKYASSPALEECATKSMDAGNPLEGTVFRAKFGWHALGSLVKAHLDEAEQREPYVARYSNILNGDLLFPGCETLKMATNSAMTFADAYCACNAIRLGSKRCAAIHDVSLMTGCMSQVPKDQAYCETPDFLSPELHIPTQCTTGFGSGSYLDLIMLDSLYGGRRHVPDEIDISGGSITAQEGMTYYLAWMAQQRLNAVGLVYQNCDAQADADIGQHKLLPGWDHVMMLNAAQDGEVGAIPSAALLRRGEENFMIVVRDAATTFEGRLLAQYEMALKYANNYVGPAQETYAALLAAITGPLDLYFQQFFNSQFNKTDYKTTLVLPRILVVGAGPYGGGLAAVVAHYLANRWDGRSLDTPWAPLLTVDAILFGAPRVGSAEFAASYKQKVNGRNIVSKHNAEAMQPCSLQPLCDTHQAVTGATGDFTAYGDLGGKIIIDTTVSDAFSKESRWKESSARTEFFGHSVCAVRCWLTHHYCVDDPHTMCDPATCPGLFDNAIPLHHEEDADDTEQHRL